MSGREQEPEHADMTDREREQFTVRAIRHISLESAELVNLRGRIATADALLARGADPQHVRAVLRGEEPW